MMCCKSLHELSLSHFIRQRSCYTPASKIGDGPGDDRIISGVLGGDDALGPDVVSPVTRLVTTPAVRASGWGSPTTMLSVKRGAVA